MLGASTHGLDRSPHVAFSRHQIPARGQERVSFNPAAFINRQRSSTAAIRQYPRPSDISIALYHGMSATEFMGFVGVEGGVNSSKNYIRASIACHLPNLLASASS